MATAIRCLMKKKENHEKATIIIIIYPACHGPGWLPQ